MNSSDITATAELGLRLVVPERTAVPLVARLDYSADDPYAIRVAFHTGEDSPVEWIFARELLTVGIVRPVGEGDVRVWPSKDESGERSVSIALSSPFGQAEFDTQVPPLAEFLHRTYEIVPAGQEGRFVDLDQEIQQHLHS
ncbi:SsgA family sporulation/cell division regulator [Nocardiopsis alkaliphila]|uniref:SsgA family sporulation/cell division regulator n=1 Tax=Nocardiopsis alkaliphila TaxID=225762 RepID=UPI00034B939E|nr:SsgA family sporulation/cell division regulator [Nocardiopsis alkaliphila]